MPPAHPAHSPPSLSPWALLRDVSRSFYLSVRVLPRGLREPVAVGYLLARASDTVADTPGLPARERELRLAELCDAVQRGRALPASFSHELAALQPTPGESQLLGVLPACIAWALALPADDLDDVRWVLASIVRGQVLDVQRFEGATRESPRSLQSAADLEEYTWLVAGCVGEFWTRLALRHSPGFTLVPSDDMFAWGRAFGQALQLVNILRDRDADRAIGRDYLPVEASDTARWKSTARAGLDDGLRYACAIRPFRLRLASALPALLGARTLALMETSPGTKMPRGEVRGLLLRLLAAGCSARALRSEYERLAEGAPIAGWDNRAR